MIIVGMPLLSKEGKGKRGEDDDDECSAYPTVRQNSMIINTITSQIFSFSFSLLYCTALSFYNNNHNIVVLKIYTSITKIDFCLPLFLRVM
jgi:hypothetical protein